MQKGSKGRQFASGGSAVAAATLLAFLMRQAGMEVPQEIVGAMATVIGYVGGRLG